MEPQELRDKIKELTIQYLRERGKDDTQVMVAIVLDTGELYTSGYGCLLCSYEAMTEYIKVKQLKHNGHKPETIQ